MKAVCWHGFQRCAVDDTVPDQNFSAPARCNCQNYVNNDFAVRPSLYDISFNDGKRATSRAWFTGVVEVGSAVIVKIGDRLFYCTGNCFLPKDLSSLCDNSNQTLDS